MCVSVSVRAAGGIGSSALLYLAAAGVGRLHVVDFDKVELSNLHRQILHDEAGAARGENKAHSAVRRLAQLNSAVPVVAHDTRLGPENALSLLTPMDIVVDATDNLETRYLLSDACVLLGKPLVAGSAVALEGQATVLCGRGGPCYRCLHPLLDSHASQSERSCADAGVLGTVPGLIGCLQATEVIKLLCMKVNQQSVNNSPLMPFEPLVGRQCYYDGLRGEFHSFDVSARDSDCAACGLQPSITTMEESWESIRSTLGARSTSCAPQQADLPTSQRVSAASFAEQLTQRLQDRSAGSAALCLLDVRVATQFEMVSLSKHYNGSDSQDSSSSSSEKKRLCDGLVDPLVLHRHIPWARLRAMSAEEAGRSLFGAESDALRPTPLPPVFVVCRRGVDSVSATRHLASMGFEAFNIDGGLTAWHDSVDDSFPLY